MNRATRPAEARSVQLLKNLAHLVPFEMSTSRPSARRDTPDRSINQRLVKRDNYRSPIIIFHVSNPRSDYSSRSSRASAERTAGIKESEPAGRKEGRKRNAGQIPSGGCRQWSVQMPIAPELGP